MNEGVATQSIFGKGCHYSVQLEAMGARSPISLANSYRTSAAGLAERLALAVFGEDGLKQSILRQFIYRMVNKLRFQGHSCHNMPEICKLLSLLDILNTEHPAAEF